MISTKQRAALRAKAQKLEPIFQIGKNGVTDTLLQQLSQALDARELIKISVLQSCDDGAKDIINDLAASLNAEPVQAIGSKIVLYRYSERDGVVHIVF